MSWRQQSFPPSGSYIPFTSSWFLWSSISWINFFLLYLIKTDVMIETICKERYQKHPHLGGAENWTPDFKCVGQLYCNFPISPAHLEVNFELVSLLPLPLSHILSVCSTTIHGSALECSCVLWIECSNCQPHRLSIPYSFYKIEQLVTCCWLKKLVCSANYLCSFLGIAFASLPDETGMRTLGF